MCIGKDAPVKLGVEFIGRVGWEDADKLVIVPWQPGWWYYTVGRAGIRYLVKQDNLT